MKRWLRMISLLMSVLLLSANLHAMTARAANLDGANAAKIASAITSTAVQKAQKQGKDYFKTLANGRIIYVKGFRVTNLNAPVHGQLLDTSATVTADSGLSWEVPVIWVDQNGNMLKIALEVAGVVNCYPIFAFYLPEGYAMAMGDNVSYDISMPDFVTNLMAKSGVATLSNPSSGVTYITPLLPGKNRVEANPTPQYTAYDEETEYESAPAQQEAKPVVPEEQQAGENGGGGGKGGRNGYKKYDPKLNEEEAQELVKVHSDTDSQEELEKVASIDEYDLAWFISFVKNVVEPEAASLLEQKFPAYKEAAKNNELGDKLGLYVYISPKSGGQTTDESGTSVDSENSDNSKSYGENDAVAKIDWSYGADGELTYSLGINLDEFYELTTVEDKDGNKTQKYVFKEDKAYDLLDNTLLHEMMHVHMMDYTRTGMTGMQYNEDADGNGSYSEVAEAKFPTWFIEGMGMAVDNPYQYLNGAFTEKYGNKSGEDGSTVYDAVNLAEKYQSDSSIKLGADGTEGTYASGYLANVYLAYLAALKYDKQDAIKTKDDKVTAIDSKVILSGMNHILEEIHGGKTLDQVISDISPKSSDDQLYSGTEDFASKFIASSDVENTDGGASADFCAKLLSYFEVNSDKDKKVNGSILLDFDDTSSYQLSKNLLKGKEKKYVIQDTKEEKSTVDSKKAQESGGTSVTGIGSTGGGEDSSGVSDEDTTEKPGAAPSQAAKPADVNGNDNGDTDSVSEGNTIDKPSEDSEDKDSAKEQDKDKKSDNSSDDADEAASESSSADEIEEEEEEETAEFPAEDSDPENDPEEEVAEPSPEPAPSIAPEPPAAPEETAQPEALQPEASQPEIAPELEPAPAEDYNPPSMVISESEPEPAPEPPASQENNQEVLDAVKPEPQAEENGVSADAAGE